MSGRLNVGHAVGVQRRRRGENDEQRDEVRNSHSDEGVGANAREFRPGVAGRDAKRLDVASMQFFHLLPGLPEEQIGADRRAKDGDHGHGMRRVKNEMRNEGAVEGRSPRHVRGEDDRHVGEQATASPI